MKTQEFGDLAMGRRTLLIVFKPSSQYFNDIARAWGGGVENTVALAGGDEVDIIGVEEAICSQFTGLVINVDD